MSSHCCAVLLTFGFFFFRISLTIICYFFCVLSVVVMNILNFCICEHEKQEERKFFENVQQWGEIFFNAEQKIKKIKIFVKSRPNFLLQKSQKKFLAQYLSFSAVKSKHKKFSSQFHIHAEMNYWFYNLSHTKKAEFEKALSS